MSDSIPAVLSRRFLSREELGVGGMGRVVLVEDLHDARRLRALKWVASTSLDNPNVRQHRHEYQLLSTWRHPYILPVYDFCRLPSHDLQYFTMDHLSGPSLDVVLEAQQLDAARAVVGQLLHALAFVHHQGWVHCDVKPHNVLMREAIGVGIGQACLIDFGLAAIEGEGGGEDVLGTVHYTPPERFDQRPLDRRGDLYAIGVILYQIVTGRLPFSGRRKVDVVVRQLQSRPIAPSVLVEGGVDPALDDLILGLLEREPADRPRDAHEVLEVLARVWDEVDEVECPAVLSAYVDRVHHAGWERPLAWSTGRLLRSAPGPWGENPEFRDDDAVELLPLRSALAGNSTSRLQLVFGGRTEDRERFAAAVVRRAEIVGVPQIHLRGQKALFAYLSSRVAEVATAPHLVDGPRVQQAAVRIDQACAARREPESDDLRSVASWVRRVSTDVPLLVVVHQRSALAGIHSLLDECCAQDRESAADFHWLVLVPAADHEVWDNRWSGWSESVQLGGLDAEAHVRWWTRRLGDWRPPTALDSMLERECEGSPALLSRLFRAFLDSGVVERRRGRWSIGPRGGLGVDLDSLPGGSAREVLEAIAAAGVEATFDVIATLTGRTERDLRDTVDILESAWLVRRDALLEFSDLRDHFAIKDACDVDRWRRLKRQVAELIESEPEHPGRAERLARAWLATGEHGRGLAWTVRAAAEANDQGDPAGAHRVLERAAEVIGLLPQPIAESWVSLRRRFGPVDSARRVGREIGVSEGELALLDLLTDELSSGCRRAASVEDPPDELVLAMAEAAIELGMSITLPRSAGASGWGLDLGLLSVESSGDGDPVLIAADAVARAERRQIPAEWQAYLWGRFQETSGRYELAVSAYRLAAFVFGQRRDLRFQARALIRLAGCLVLQDDPVVAHRTASRAEDLIGRVGGIVERRWLADVQATLGRSRPVVRSQAE